MIEYKIPSDVRRSATAAADTYVILHDDSARDAGLVYWNMVRSWSRPLLELSERCPAAVVEAFAHVAQRPSDHRSYDALIESLVDHAHDPHVAELLEEAWVTETKSRIGYSPGRGRSEGLIDAVRLEDLQRLRTTRAAAPARASIVIPFRDTNTDSPGRLRNLLACLAALRDQSAAPEDYSVVVVETDSRPRWQSEIEALSDGYLFAQSTRPFNRSWALNVGAQHHNPASELLVLMDADVLTDRDFVARNLARFDVPGVGGLNPYRDMFCMDPRSTNVAIRDRVLRQQPQLDVADIRGFRLRRPRGCLLWVRREAYTRVGGFDERYEGWGGEDYDFIHRLDYETPLDTFEDPLLHMHHPPSSVVLESGELITSHVPALSWPADETFGQLERFAHVGA